MTTDKMTEELNRAVEQSLNPGTARGRLVGGDRNGAMGALQRPPSYAPDTTQGDMLEAAAQHNAMLRAHLDAVISDLQDLRAKL